MNGPTTPYAGALYTDREQRRRGWEGQHQGVIRAVDSYAEVAGAAAMKAPYASQSASLHPWPLPSVTSPASSSPSASPTSAPSPTPHTQDVDPRPRSNVACRHFLAGRCTRGDRCKYVHPDIKIIESIPSSSSLPPPKDTPEAYPPLVSPTGFDAPASTHWTSEPWFLGSSGQSTCPLNGNHNATIPSSITETQSMKVPESETSSPPLEPVTAGAPEPPIGEEHAARDCPTVPGFSLFSYSLWPADRRSGSCH